MKIETYSKPEICTFQDFTHRTAVVIDVLRASTSMTVAMRNGCREIIPTDDVARAFEIAAGFPKQNVLLCGERNGLKIEGFDLGNSPLEYSNTMVENRILVLTTSNGTRAIQHACMAERIIIAALINLSVVSKYLVQQGKDIAILCAGRAGEDSLEDSVCAGLLVQHMLKLSLNTIVLSDNASEMVTLSQKYKNDLLNMLVKSKHGKYLMKLGMKNDLEFCARLNSANIISVYDNGIINRLMNT